jgi:transcriptional regulator
MYIPPYFEWKDRAATLQFVRRYNFALLITAGAAEPVATHLPFVVSERADGWHLTSHMAAANAQSELLEAGPCLVVFSEPHAYVSPTLYERRENVPTWNYLAVHCYGKATLLPTNAQKIEVLEQMIQYLEPAYQAQWQSLSPRYRDNLLGELTAFEIHVSRIEAKAKLSQNKTTAERERIARHFAMQGDGAAKYLGDYMNAIH